MSEEMKRPGEVALSFDPAETANDASLIFIGQIRSPWATRSDCPKNIARAREAGQGARLEVDPEWRPGLEGLSEGQTIVVIYWMHQSPRNLIIQKPRHREHPAGVFSLRSPARPNPLAMAVVTIDSIDADAGRVAIDAIDCMDGTPLVDIKPWLPTVDVPTEF